MFELSVYARMIILVMMVQTHCVAQETSGAPNSAVSDPSVKADEIKTLMDSQAVETVSASEPTSIDLLTLILQGGAFMIPIGLMSIMVVTLAVERMINLRKECILPDELERDLNLLNSPPETFNPVAALKACKDHACAASRIIQAMLNRTGQPLHEIEQAGLETAQREIDKCATPIRWLNLAGAATPLMGLLGTVWGMIVAFHESTTLTPDRSRSEQLSEGIYTALTTTLAGLVVAIPAAILALYLENRLLKMFNTVEDFVFKLSPSLTRFIGQGKLDSEGQFREIEPLSVPTEAIPAPPRSKSSGSLSASHRGGS